MCVCVCVLLLGLLEGALRSFNRRVAMAIATTPTATNVQHGSRTDEEVLVVQIERTVMEEDLLRSSRPPAKIFSLSITVTSHPSRHIHHLKHFDPNGATTEEPSITVGYQDRSLPHLLYHLVIIISSYHLANQK